MWIVCYSNIVVAGAEDVGLKVGGEVSVCGF